MKRITLNSQALLAVQTLTYTTSGQTMACVICTRDFSEIL